MSTCSSCGAARSDIGPFCPVCGADGRAAVDWLGASPGSSPLAESTVVVRSSVGRSNAVMVGVGLVAVMVLGWAALGRSGEAPAESAGPSTTVAPAGDSGSTTTEPTTTTTAPRRSTTSSTEPEPGGPVLGYEIGLVAIGPSTILDLDTGRRLEVDLPGGPVGAVDGFLLTVENDAVWAVPLGDLDGPAQLIVDGPQAQPLQIGRSRTDGAVWVSDDVALSRWQLVDLATGSLLDELGPVSDFWVQPGLSHLGPEFLSPLSGGVFEWGEGGYRRVGDGFLLTVSGDIALVLDCNDPMQCLWQRHAVADWSAIGDPIEATGSWANLVAMGRLMLRENEVGESELFDFASGTAVTALGQSDIWEGFYSDESGRFVTFRSGNEARLLDLDTGESANLRLFNNAVLVPRDDVAWLLGAQP